MSTNGQTEMISWLYTGLIFQEALHHSTSRMSGLINHPPFPYAAVYREQISVIVSVEQQLLLLICHMILTQLCTILGLLGINILMYFNGSFQSELQKNDITGRSTGLQVTGLAGAAGAKLEIDIKLFLDHL